MASQGKAQADSTIGGRIFIDLVWKVRIVKQPIIKIKLQRSLLKINYFSNFYKALHHSDNTKHDLQFAATFSLRPRSKITRNRQKKLTRLWLVVAIEKLCVDGRNARPYDLRMNSALAVKVGRFFVRPVDPLLCYYHILNLISTHKYHQLQCQLVTNSYSRNFLWQYRTSTCM